MPADTPADAAAHATTHVAAVSATELTSNHCALEKTDTSAHACAVATSHAHSHFLPVGQIDYVLNFDQGERPQLEHEHLQYLVIIIGTSQHFVTRL